MDDLDHLADRDELITAQRIATFRKPAGPAPTGHCLWCDEPLPLNHRWCDAACQINHFKQQRAEAQRPKE